MCPGIDEYGGNVGCRAFREGARSLALAFVSRIVTDRTLEVAAHSRAIRQYPNQDRFWKTRRNLSAQSNYRRFWFTHRIEKNIPYLLFHAVAVQGGSSLQAHLGHTGVFR